MGILLRQTDDRSELQNRVAAELTDRLKDTPPIRADEVEPRLLENQHQTRLAGMIIGALFVVAVIVAVILVH